jgi:MFS superfamily sulfate permease-like transporter
VVGADSATAAIMAAGLVGIAAVGSPEYVPYAGVLALMTGAILIAARLVRLGFLADFLSKTVLIGFLTGVGIQVAMGQIGGMFGVPQTGGNTVAKFVNALSNLGQTNLDTLLVSIGVLVVIVGSGFVSKRIPGALVAVVGAIVLSAVLDLSSKGVAILGPVPSGLPRLGLPTGISASHLGALVGTAFSMFLVILAQSAATSRAYAMKYNEPFDENVDLVGLGVANAAAGLSGTFVVNGSPTKTEMLDGAGGRTQLASLVTVGIVIVVLLFLSKQLQYMPEAVLASVVFLIGVRLVKLKGMIEIFKVRMGEFAVAAITAVVVVVVGVEQGILLAIALSLVVHVAHSYRPSDQVLFRQPAGHWRAIPIARALQTGEIAAVPGLAVYRFGANLYYANANRFSEEIIRLVEAADPPLRWIIIAAGGIGDVDFSAAATLRQVHAQLRDRGVTLALADVEAEVKKEFDSYGLTQEIGPEYFFERLEDAGAAYETRGHAPESA